MFLLVFGTPVCARDNFWSNARIGGVDGRFVDVVGKCAKVRAGSTDTFKSFKRKRALSSEGEETLNIRKVGNRQREIKLLCPSLSMVANTVAWDEQKIDIGSIARAFGLDPSTLRLNGHFISRGMDLISSSVTWKSLLSFFSAKGLSTGKDDRDALVVTGKLCKLGNKRGHDCQDFQNGIGKVMDSQNGCSSRGTQLEAINLLRNKKLRESNSDEILNGLSCKRKQLLEDVNLYKKLKINEDKSDIRDHSSSISCSQFTCSYTRT